MIEFPIDVTKEFILNRISQEEIYEEYGEHVTHYMHRSTLRSDNKPTCKFYRRSNGQLILHDYNGDFWGDCFDYVMRKTGKSFYHSLDDIALRFELISNNGVLVHIERVPLIPKIKIEPDLCKIRVKRRAWTTSDLKMWELIGVSQGTLQKFHVAPLDRAWLNDNPIFWYGHQNEIAYVYYFPNYGEFEYKLYFPFRKDYRFIHANANVLQGFHQMPGTGDFAIITKSYKDVLALYEFGIPACAPMAETMIVSPGEADGLSNRFSKIFTLYDIDKLAGVDSMQKMKKLYQWTPLFFNVRKGLPKDFTDYIKKSGVETTRLLVNNIKDLYL